MADGQMVVELYETNTGTVISSITVSNGSSATLTGVIDLPEGDSQICIRMYPAEVDGWGTYTGAALQVILGQTVETPGCVQYSGGA